MSRRRQIAMTQAEIDAYLAAQLTMIVVSNGPDGYPHPMPMHFCVEADRAIAMTTYARSQKVRNLERDPRATLLVESGSAYEALRSVLVYASAEIVTDDEATAACMAACRQHSNAVRGIVTSAEDDRTFAAAAARRAAKRLVLRFRPDRYVSWDHAKLGGIY